MLLMLVLITTLHMLLRMHAEVYHRTEPGDHVDGQTIASTVHREGRYGKASLGY